MHSLYRPKFLAPVTPELASNAVNPPTGEVRSRIHLARQTGLELAAFWLTGDGNRAGADFNGKRPACDSRRSFCKSVRGSALAGLADLGIC